MNNSNTIIQYEYLGVWRTLDDIHEYLKTLTSDGKVINTILEDVLKYAKIRYLIKKER